MRISHFLRADGSLLHGLYYNRWNDQNLSNIDKTESAILGWWKHFTNVVIFLERGDSKPYETAGRYQTEREARQIDHVLKHTLDKQHVEYNCISAFDKKAIVKHVSSELEKVLGPRPVASIPPAVSSASSAKPAAAASSSSAAAAAVAVTSKPPE